MNLFSIVIFVTLVTNILGLMPKKLPNGKLLKFEANQKSLITDLKNIKPGQASLITRNWLENIVLDITNKKNNKDKDLKKNYFFEYDDLHIVSSINKLESYIQESYNKNDDDSKYLFLAWTPMGIHGRTETLFIILVKLFIKEKIFSIEHLVQSPYWIPEQIDSNILKESLILQNKENNCTSINFDNLYNNNIRYKLSWDTWNLDLNDK